MLKQQNPEFAHGKICQAKKALDIGPYAQVFDIISESRKNTIPKPNT